MTTLIHCLWDVHIQFALKKNSAHFNKVNNFLNEIVLIEKLLVKAYFRSWCYFRAWWSNSNWTHRQRDRRHRCLRSHSCLCPVQSAPYHWRRSNHYKNRCYYSATTAVRIRGLFDPLERDSGNRGNLRNFCVEKVNKLENIETFSRLS